MDSGKISVRYAKAIYEFALEKREEETFYQEMKFLLKSLDSFPSMKDVMNNPTVSIEDKKKILTTAAGISVSNTYKDVLQMICQNKRESYLFSIARMYETYFQKKKGIISGTLITSEPIAPDVKRKLEQLISKDPLKRVDLTMETDPSLIGGFIIEVDSNLLDASMKSQLNKIKYQLTELNKNVLK